MNDEASPDQLSTTLPVRECIERLHNRTDSSWKAFGDNPVVGSISDSKAKLTKRINNRNSFQTVLTARFSEKNGKTLIELSSGMHISVKIFMTIWFGFIISFLIGFMNSNAQNQLPGMVIPFGMMLFGIALILVGRYMARDEQRFLIDFLCQSLNAHPIEPHKSPFAPKN